LSAAKGWQAAVQLGLGGAWLASSIWHQGKYNAYKDLREATPDEFRAAYNETKLPRGLRIGFGTAFGVTWLLNTILAVHDAGEYQELRERSELALMPGGVKVSRRF
jgi:hypothetical protein